MPEQKSQTRSIPLRLRFRVSNDTISTQGDSLRHTQPLVLDLSHMSDTERRVQQIRELGRLGPLLRADMSLDEVLQQIVASTAACTGFRVMVMRLWDEESKQLTAVAFNGVREEGQRMLSAAPVSWEALQRLMQPEFRVSDSYFISHEHVGCCAEKLLMLSKPANEYAAGTWHPDDLLFVPFYSSCGQKLLGTVSLDDPVDGQIPTGEGIEIVQLFVNMAATAIDNVKLFQEREGERIVLEEATSLFCEDVKALQKSDFRHPIRVRHSCLEPVVNTINTMATETSDILGSMRMVTRAVDEHMYSVQRHTERMLHDEKQQETQVRHISQVIGEMAKAMQHITERAAMLAKTAVEAASVALDAQSVVECTVQGMMGVRESTLRSAHTMKELIESSQEINAVVSTPTELTTRLHLLALNAAIEATRAGEQGRGFALIAQELRSLATSSKEPARKIEGFIRSAQHETLVVLQSIEESTQHMIMQTNLIIQAGGALEIINTITEQLSSLIQGIYVVAENQSQGSQMAVNALDEVFQAKNDITSHIEEMQQSLVHLVELTNVLRSRMALLQSREH